MGRDIQSDAALRRHHQTRTTMKGLFSSTTILGVFIALFSKIVGIEVSHGEAADIFAQGKALWPVLVGIAADLAAFWYRVKATNFTSPPWQSRTFWAGIISGSMTLTAAFGLDLTGMQSIFERGLAAWPAISALVGSVMIIVGRWRATRKIAVH